MYLVPAVSARIRSAWTTTRSRRYDARYRHITSPWSTGRFAVTTAAAEKDAASRPSERRLGRPSRRRLADTTWSSTNTYSATRRVSTSAVTNRPSIPFTRLLANPLRRGPSIGNQSSKLIPTTRPRRSGRQHRFSAQQSVVRAPVINLIPFGSTS
jgi:hypothetical protein